MKKKNLAILLIIPFLVALFGIVTINAAFNLIDNDVISINWNYHDNELFEVGKQITLQAEGVVADKRYPASAGNRLVWTVENDDGAAEPHAEIVGDSSNSLLKTNSEGKVIITCSTEKGNVTPVRMTGLIYKDSAFVINTKVGGSGQNVDSTVYYGEFDLSGGKKQPAVVDFDITVSSDDLLKGIEVDAQNTTSNLSVDMEGKKIKILSPKQGTSCLTLKNATYNLSTSFNFEVVADGINIYEYQDLLYCTNYSEDGEIAVLRKSFESEATCQASTAENVALFGNESGFNFKDEVYRFPTTYNSEYIDQWNNFASTNSSYSKISGEILAGLHVQKDFYGNGYTLNLHNICFPTSYKTITDSGNTYDYYTPSDSDLFKGPKPFYLLGDPNSSLPLVTAYGQDNIGVYIHGNNITVNDVKIKNCDFGLIVDNLNYTGTVVEVNGNGNTIKNSVLSNGKNILRSFSSTDLTVDNCILSTSRNFLLSVGSNKYQKNDPADTTQHTFTKLNSSKYIGTLSNYLQSEGDKILNQFAVGVSGIDQIMGDSAATPEYSKDDMKTALHSLQSGLNCQNKITEKDVDGSTQISNTIFYRSGIASIGVETMFNGPFLYNNSPSMVQLIMSMFGSLTPMLPDNISGSSYPVSVNLSGNTRFFDYKSLQEWDISGLIDQNISTVVSNIGLGDVNITIDDIFPLKQILTNVAKSNNLIYNANGLNYINIPIAFYGGGINLSQVTTNGLTSGGLTQPYTVDLLDSYLNMTTPLDLNGFLNGGGLGSVASDPNFMKFMRETLTKTVTTVTGFEPFKFSFIDKPQGLFDEQSGKPLSPDYRNLIRA